jgi:eukaryotic-like serine/threonine-protein kinase
MCAKRINCWEYKKCGREPDGAKAAELGECPAAADASFDGINAGKCGGRFCWAVAGTCCGGEIQGTFAEKRESCTSCDFYRRFQAEEGTANLRTKFLRFVAPGTGPPLLDGLAYKHIPCDERFMLQGEEGAAAYIIQRGACVELVEKNGELHPVGHRGEGDIVGMASLLTGEPRPYHVEAETDMDVWVLDKPRFKTISRGNPDLLQFLTEIVADRFDSKRPVAERTIGKYNATDIIGRGGFSIVYKGVHAGLEMPVAIKMMRHDMAMRPEFLETFRNEAKIIAGLNHENIVRVFDIEERYQTVFIIMEYLEGESLAAMIRRLKRIPPMLAVHFLSQLCSALIYAGQKRLIHRDINPTNTIVLPRDRIKLIDFGLACPAGTEDCHIGGAPAYMAPEIHDGEPADPRSDIFALGITAYEMVTGENPFGTDDAATCMQAICDTDIPDPTDLAPELPEELRRFIIRACKRDPHDRYRDAIEALTVLQPLIGNGNPESRPMTPDDAQRITLYLESPRHRQAEFSQLLDKFRNQVGKLGGHLVMDDGQQSESEN